MRPSESAQRKNARDFCQTEIPPESSMSRGIVHMMPRPASKSSALSRDMVARMVAHRVQEQRLGKLNAGTRNLLVQAHVAARSAANVWIHLRSRTRR